MKDIKNHMLDQMADQVLEMLKQPLKKGLSGLTLAEDMHKPQTGLPGDICNTCDKTNSAFYLHSLTQKFICSECAAKFASNGVQSRQIYPPIDIYDDGVILIQSYNQHNQDTYCIDTRYGTEEQDTYLQVHNGAEPNFESPNLVKLEKYQQCIEDIEKSCILLINYADGQYKDEVDQLLNICSGVVISLKMLANAKLEQA